MKRQEERAKESEGATWSLDSSSIDPPESALRTLSMLPRAMLYLLVLTASARADRLTARAVCARCG